MCAKPSVRTTKSIGDAGEKLAADFFVSNGYVVLEKNYRTRNGEIDLIVQNERGTIAFIEVRTRKNANHGSGSDSIVHAKKRRIMLAALHYLAYVVREDADYRFDYVSIDDGIVSHVENVDFSDVAGNYW